MKPSFWGWAMKSTRMVIFGLALVSTAAAGYLALSMKSQPVEVVQVGAPAAPRMETENVLVTGEMIPVGGILEAQLKWQEWPKSGITEGYITQSVKPQAIEELQGSIARVVIFPGEPIRDAKLVGKDQSFMSSILPAGRRAVAVEISANTSAGGFILPNDYVDMIMTRRSPGLNGGAETFVTDTILQNIRVLAIDQTIREDEEGRKVKVGQTATLELSPQQAEIVTVAQQMAERLALTLRSTADAAEKNQASADYLLNGTGKGKGSSVKVIKSGEITEVGAAK
jgi:pilus assembly protein CpaB